MGRGGGSEKISLTNFTRGDSCRWEWSVDLKDGGTYRWPGRPPSQVVLSIKQCSPILTSSLQDSSGDTIWVSCGCCQPNRQVLVNFAAGKLQLFSRKQTKFLLKFIFNKFDVFKGSLEESIVWPVSTCEAARRKGGRPSFQNRSCQLFSRN